MKTNIHIRWKNQYLPLGHEEFEAGARLGLMNSPGPWDVVLSESADSSAVTMEISGPSFLRTFTFQGTTEENREHIRQKIASELRVSGLL